MTEKPHWHRAALSHQTDYQLRDRVARHFGDIVLDLRNVQAHIQRTDAALDELCLLIDALRTRWQPRPTPNAHGTQHRH